MDSVVHLAWSQSVVAVAALFSAIWQGTALAALVLLCLRLLPRLSPAARSLIWMNVFLLLGVLHLLPGLRHPATGLKTTHQLTLDVRWSVAIAGLWVLLSLWRGMQLALSAIRMRALARRAIPIDAGPTLKAILQNGRSAELCASTEVNRPCVFGFIRPRILIPPELFEQLSPLELQQVVLHEMEHLHRRDDWTNLLQKIGLTLFPLNPVMLWVERRLCAERELACDDRVLRAHETRKAYAACLTRLAEYSMIRHSLSLVLGAWERQSELTSRVHRILQRPRRAMKNRQAIMASGGLIFASLACAIGLSGSPQWISFAPVANQANQAMAKAGDRVAHTQSALAGDKPKTNLALNVGDPGGAIRPQLIKAVMDRRPLVSSNTGEQMHGGALSSGPARAVLTPVAKQNQPRTRTWLVLTEWSDIGDELAPPRVVVAVDQDANDRNANRESFGNERSSAIDSQQAQPRYAAIPLINGWLIVQI
jgi:beta-lactamase regulating signal transducer with metallopeptidase domain